MASDIWSYIFRTILMYFVIYLTLRIMGKREIGKLSIFDLVISIMIAEIAVFVLEDIHRPIYEGIIPMATLVLIQLLIAFVSLKNRGLRLLFEGKPSILVSGGKLHREEMKKQRYNLDDLLLQLRGQKIENVSDVEFAILETSGQLTVIPKKSSSNHPNSSLRQEVIRKKSFQNTPLEPSSSSEDQSIPIFGQSRRSRKRRKILIPAGQFSYGVLPVPLIMDGKVQDDNLHRLNKTRFWLKNQIEQKGVRDFKDVFLCSIDHKGQIYVDRK
ncbi:DUF421 domain-containing protein [Paenibacillus pini]|nr:DUF421 domain-containing protein [Paenibacillus pini]